MSAVARIVMRMLVDGRLPGSFEGFARRRMQTDPTWARAYHELRTAERALEGRPLNETGLSSSQHALLRERVLAAALHKPKPVVAHAPVPWLAGCAAMASLAAFVFISPPPANDDDGYAPRSAQDPARDGGVRVHCIDAARERVLTEADLSSSPATLRCPMGGLLAFSVTNRADRARFPAVVAHDGDVVAFTVPFADEAPAGVPAGSVAMRLARGAPLEHDARPGEKVLVLRGALFDEPVPADRVARSLDDAFTTEPSRVLSLRVVVTAP